MGLMKRCQTEDSLKAVTNRSPPEEADEGRRGEEDVEDGKSESKPRMETKPLAVDKYQR